MTSPAYTKSRVGFPVPNARTLASPRSAASMYLRTSAGITCACSRLKLSHSPYTLPGMSTTELKPCCTRYAHDCTSSIFFATE